MRRKCAFPSQGTTHRAVPTLPCVASFAFSLFILLQGPAFALAARVPGVELAGAPAHRATAISGATPVLIPPSSMRVLPGETVIQVIHATDAGGDPLAFAKGSGPDYMTVTTIDPGVGVGTGQIRLAPAAGVVIGTVTASVIVSDGSLSDQAPFTIVSENFVPILTQPADMEVDPEQVADQTLSATDPDFEALTFSLALGPWFASITTIGPGTGNIHLTPVLGDSGVYAVTASVSDGTAADVKSFEVAVSNRTAPILDPLSDITIVPGQVIVRSLRATDTDGQTLYFHKVEGPEYFRVFTSGYNVPGVGYGRIELAPQLGDSPSPEGGAFTFPATVGVTDGERSASRSLVISITFPPDNPPILEQPDDMVVPEGNIGYQQLTYSDPDGEPVVVSKVAGPDFVGVAPWAILVQPTSADSGDYRATVRATDSRGLSDEKSFRVTVGNVLVPPMLSCPQPMAVFPGQTVDQEIHASDPDGDPLSFSKYRGPDYVSVTTLDAGTGVGIGRIRLRPTESDVGRDTAYVRVWDGVYSSGEAFCLSDELPYNPSGIAIEVAPPDRPFLDGAEDICLLRGYTRSVLLRAIDPEGDRLSFSQSGLPPFGSIIDNGDGTAVLSFNPSRAEPDGLTFVTVTASDGGSSDARMFAVWVGVCGGACFDYCGDNRFPTSLPGGPYTGYAGVPVTLDARGSSDPEGQPLQFAWNLGDGTVTTGPTASHVYPRAGNYVVDLIVSDGLHPERSSTTVTIGAIRGTGKLSASVFPNPMNPDATVSFVTRTPGPIRVSAFDLGGRLVRTLELKSVAPAGHHDVRLDGRAENGEKLASGIYFYRIETADGEASGRFAIVK